MKINKEELRENIFMYYPIITMVMTVFTILFAAVTNIVLTEKDDFSSMNIMMKDIGMTILIIAVIVYIISEIIVIYLIENDWSFTDFLVLNVIIIFFSLLQGFIIGTFYHIIRYFWKDLSTSIISKLEPICFVIAMIIIVVTIKYLLWHVFVEKGGRKW